MSIGSNYLSLQRSTFQGMVSGLETDTLVESLMLNAQSKIDKMNQKHTLYQYKQDSYRDVISTIDTFSNKYSSYTSSTSLISNSFFNQMTSTSSSSCFTATGTSSAIDGDMAMKISQLASTSTLSGGSISSVDSVSSQLDVSALADAAKYSVSFDFTDSDGKVTEVTLSQSDIDTLFSTGELDLNTNHSVDAKFTYKAGKMEMVSSEYSAKVTDTNTTDLGLEKLGLTSSSSTGSIETTNDEGELVTATGFSTTTKKDASATLDINLDGVTKSINLSDFYVENDAEATLAALQKQLDGLFGSESITLDYDSSGNFSFGTMQGRQITIGGSSDVLEAFNLESGVSNVLYGGSTASDVFSSAFDDGAGGVLDSAMITINGVEISIDKEDTITQMMSKINDSDAGVVIALDSFTSTFSITAEDMGDGFDLDFSTSDASGNDLLKSVMGIENNDYSLQDIVEAGADGTTLYVKDELGNDTTTALSTTYSSGQNAIFTLNGVETQRNSNTFTINGVTFELNDVHTETEYENPNFAGDVVSTSRDVDSVMAGITSFIDDYNSMIEELNSLIDEKYDKEYPPLTDAQREEMSDSEIASWEEKAKTGVLANDDLISDYLTAMRTTMYSSFGDTALWQIGIEASSDTSENGKLYIDEDVLRQTLMEDPDTVRELFAGTDGLVSAVSSVCKTYANTSSASPGLLVERAGVVGTATEYNNNLYNWMQDCTSKLEKLEYNYTLQYDRYWAAFTNMETVLSQLSSQSAWLSQQFGY